MASKENGNIVESEFEFIETPKAPIFEKPEDFGVKTTSVWISHLRDLEHTCQCQLNTC
jgi:hypothetical protein